MGTGSEHASNIAVGGCGELASTKSFQGSAAKLARN